MQNIPGKAPDRKSFSQHAENTEMQADHVSVPPPSPDTPLPVYPTSKAQNEPLSEAEGAQSAPLGIHADFASTSFLDLKHQDALNRRFILQSFARDLLPDHRIKNCFRVPTGGLVELYHHAEFSAASYGGLQTCGSPHVCPVCSSKIAERRAQEITAGITKWMDRGGGVVMATFTLQHERGDDLRFLVSVLRGASRNLKAGARWKLFGARYGLLGSITACEYTYGRHGWHPHLHSLMLVRGGLKRAELVELEQWLKVRWSSGLDSLGGYASWDHGVKVQIADEVAADYVSKAGRNWTLADELTKANTKLGRRGGLSIPQLLWAAGLGDPEAARLFQQFEKITFNTSPVRWSPGLRTKLNIGAEKTDEEIAKEQLANGRLMLLFERDQWRVVLAHDARADVLLEARAGDVERVLDFLGRLGIRMEPWQFDPLLMEKVRNT